MPEPFFGILAAAGLLSGLLPLKQFAVVNPKPQETAMNTKKQCAKRTPQQDIFDKLPINIQQAIYLLASVIKHMEKQERRSTCRQ